MKRITAALLLATWAWSAYATAPIYRCGPGGRQYSQTPCPEGRIIDAADPRSAAQRAEANRVAAQERRQAAEMARERRALQAATQPAQASGFNARPQLAQAPALAPARGKHQKSKKGKVDGTSDFIAVEPGAKKKGSAK